MLNYKLVYEYPLIVGYWLRKKKEANWRNNKNQFASHPTKQPYLPQN